MENYSTTGRPIGKNPFDGCTPQVSSQLNKFLCSVDPRLGLMKERLALWSVAGRTTEGWALLVWRRCDHTLEASVFVLRWTSMRYCKGRTGKRKHGREKKLGLVSCLIASVTVTIGDERWEGRCNGDGRWSYCS